MKHLIPYLSVFSLLLAGCQSLATVKVEVLDERTQLENQVLGEYEALSDDLALVASVRGVDETGEVRVPPPVSAGKKRSLEAMQTREFHRDDIEEFKKTGVLGERNDGLVEVFEDAKMKSDSQHAAFVRQVVKEENDARMILMQRVIEMNPGMGSKDLPAVQKVMAGRNRDRALAGHKIQLEDGQWITKAEEKASK